MSKGFMYLIAIVDLYSRMVLTWSVSNTMGSEWCAEVPKEAIAEFGKPEIFNTDRTGGPARLTVYLKYLYPSFQRQSSTDFDAAMELDGKGRAVDNIFVERVCIPVNKIYAKVKEFISQDIVESWFKEIPYEQIETGVNYGISQNKRGKVNDMVKYLQKMVRTEINPTIESITTTKPATIIKIENQDTNAEITSLKAVSDTLFNKICEDLLNQHKTLKNEIIINMQAGMFAKFYNQQLSFEQNIKDPMVGGAMKGLIQQAFPEAFAENDKLIKRLKHHENRGGDALDIPDKRSTLF